MSDNKDVRVTRIGPPLAPQGNRCGQCFYFHHGAQENGQGFCRRWPPQVMFLPVSTQPVVKGGERQLHWINNAAYPVVARQTEACGEFCPGPALTN